MSLSARRAWIEIAVQELIPLTDPVAHPKESVDRNREQFKYVVQCRKSLSARRAWIEIPGFGLEIDGVSVALRKESVDRNNAMQVIVIVMDTVALRKESVDRNMDNIKFSWNGYCRSPQGERG